MSGYHPAGTLPDYVVDPGVRKTMDEWREIYYPNGAPWWFWIAKLMIRMGFAVRDGKLVYDPKAYRS